MRTSPSRQSDFVSDRGTAKYFHGRKKILQDFGALLVYSSKNKSGTIFLIQGAPGAGKSALLEECEKRAREKGWKTAEIKPQAFWDPDALRDFLGLGKFPWSTFRSLKIGVSGASVTVGRASRTIRKILRKGKQPLLLILDEAQTLKTSPHPPDDRGTNLEFMLDEIHNGKMDRPVILIAAGLGTTVDAFKSLGISRFSETCLVELGALGKEPERAVLHDWLTKEGEAKGDPTVWVETIAQETYGWPQHIVSYAKPALKQLEADNRVMTPEGLNAVLEAGRGFRSDYYERRADDFSRKQRHSLAKLIMNVPLGEGLDKEDILSSLTQEYGETEAEKLFNRALHRGVLHRYKGTYVVPIPSMQDWLVTNYAHIQIKSPPQTMEIRRSPGRNPGMDLGR